MTDKEIALDLGVRLFRARLLLDGMKLELELARDAGMLRSPNQIAEEAREQILLPAYQERIEELRHKLDEATPDALLQTLQKSLQELF